MEFIIKETGKRVTAECRNERQDGCAEDVAINCGLDISLRDDEENAYVVSQEDADWWVEFFQTLNVCAEEIEGLEKKYSGEEIREILNDEMGEFDIDYYEEAIKRTADILQKRYNTENARLVSSYESDLSSSEFSYVKESLYQRDDGSYFLAGEGGEMTRYSQMDGCDGCTYGEGSYSITAAEAQEWLAEHHDKVSR